MATLSTCTSRRSCIYVSYIAIFPVMVGIYTLNEILWDFLRFGEIWSKSSNLIKKHLGETFYLCLQLFVKSHKITGGTTFVSHFVNKSTCLGGVHNPKNGSTHLNSTTMAYLQKKVTDGPSLTCCKSCHPLMILSCAFVYKICDKGNFSYLRSSPPVKLDHNMYKWFLTKTSVLCRLCSFTNLKRIHCEKTIY